MTPQEFLISEGYDPALYTLDAEGYPTPLPPKRKISPVAAFGANAARALAPAGAALLAGAVEFALAGKRKAATPPKSCRKDAQKLLQNLLKYF